MKRKIKKKVSKKEILRVGREYMERMQKKFKTGKQDEEDDYIDCPKCLGWRTIFFFNGWKCHNTWNEGNHRFTCFFEFPEELTPSSPEESKYYYNRRKIKEKIDTFN